MLKLWGLWPETVSPRGTFCHVKFEVVTLVAADDSNGLTPYAVSTNN
jgi:hypothetical protein